MNAFSFEFSIGEDVLHGLLVDRAAHTTYGELADELYNVHRSHLTVVNVLIVRHPVEESLPVNTVQTEITPVLERVLHLPIHVLGSVDFTHCLTDNLNPQVLSVLQKADYSVFIDQIRQEELERYATEANAVLRTSGASLFRAPSGKYCRTFLRVGNVQKNREAIDAFFFWLCHGLRSATQLLARLGQYHHLR